MSGQAAAIASGRDERRVLIPERIAQSPSPVAVRSLAVRELGGETMGTTWSTKLVVPPGADLAPLRDGIERVLRRVIDEMSPWEPASHISRFNEAPSGTWHRLPDGFFAVLSAALHWAERTGGAYDPTVGAAVNLWGFGPEDRHAPIPTDEAIRNAQARGGWQRVRIERETLRAFQPGGLVLDLSSIAKGFAVDEVARFVRRHGTENALVEIGGELRGEGVKPDGTPWWVELERPRGAIDAASALPVTLLALSGHSVATSGDERRFFDIGGRRYAHTLDPATGAPVTHDLVSVAVVADDCMTADALATALTVLGPGAGPAFAAAHRLAARFVCCSEFGLTEQLSPAMAAMLD